MEVTAPASLTRKNFWSPACQAMPLVSWLSGNFPPMDTAGWLPDGNGWADHAEAVRAMIVQNIGILGSKNTTISPMFELR
jgi:hypothetical protein